MMNLRRLSTTLAATSLAIALTGAPSMAVPSPERTATASAVATTSAAVSGLGYFSCHPMRRAYDHYTLCWLNVSILWDYLGTSGTCYKFRAWTENEWGVYKPTNQYDQNCK